MDELTIGLQLTSDLRLRLPFVSTYFSNPLKAVEARLWRVTKALLFLMEGFEASGDDPGPPRVLGP